MRKVSNFRCTDATNDAASNEDCGHGGNPRPQVTSEDGLASAGQSDDDAVGSVDQKVLVVDTNPALPPTRLSQAMAAIITAIDNVTTFRRR